MEKRGIVCRNFTYSWSACEKETILLAVFFGIISIGTLIYSIGSGILVQCSACGELFVDGSWRFLSSDDPWFRVMGEGH